MDNKVSQRYRISGYYRKRKFSSQWEEPDFFSRIDFYMSKTVHQHWRMV